MENCKIREKVREIFRWMISGNPVLCHFCPNRLYKDIFFPPVFVISCLSRNALVGLGMCIWDSDRSRLLHKNMFDIDLQLYFSDPVILWNLIWL